MQAGRDYHKLIRKRLQKLATRIKEEAGPFGYRAFVDSAPVLERALAEKSGIGLDRQEHDAHKQEGRFLVLSWRTLYRSTATRRRASF